MKLHWNNPPQAIGLALPQSRERKKKNYLVTRLVSCITLWTRLSFTKEVHRPTNQQRCPQARLHAGGVLSAGLENAALSLPDQGHLGPPEEDLKGFDPLSVDPRGQKTKKK